METQFLTFTALAVAFVIAMYGLYTRKVEKERNRYRNAARRFSEEAKKNYRLYAKEAQDHCNLATLHERLDGMYSTAMRENKELNNSVAHWKKTAESNNDLHVKAIREKHRYRGMAKTLELERDALKRSEQEVCESLQRRMRLIAKLSDNRAYTRTSPGRHWRRQDKLLELKFRNPDGSYEQF